jgi:hypothetical protein
MASAPATTTAGVKKFIQARGDDRLCHPTLEEICAKNGPFKVHEVQRIPQKLSSLPKILVVHLQLDPTKEALRITRIGDELAANTAFVKLLDRAAEKKAFLKVLSTYEFYDRAFPDDKSKRVKTIDKAEVLFALENKSKRTYVETEEEDLAATAGAEPATQQEDISEETDESIPKVKPDVPVLPPPIKKVAIAALPILKKPATVTKEAVDAQLVPNPTLPTRRIFKIMQVTGYLNFGANDYIGGLVQGKELREVKAKVGKILQFTLCDAQSRMRCVAFGSIAEKMNQIIEEGGCYLIRSPTITKRDPRFSNAQKDPAESSWELQFGVKTGIVVATEKEVAEIGANNSYHFVRDIEQLRNTDDKSFIDVLGICAMPGEMRSIKSDKNPRGEVTKRDITLVILGAEDVPCCSIQLTLWDRNAERYDPQMGDVIALRSVQLRSYKGKTLSLNQSNGHLQILKVEDARCIELNNWWALHSSDWPSQCTPLTDEIAAEDAKYAQFEQLKNNPQTERKSAFTFATVVAIRRGESDVDWFVQACPKCRTQVKKTKEGWYCENVSHNALLLSTTPPIPSYRLQLTLSDMSGSIQVTAFGEIAEVFLFGKKCEETLVMPGSERGEMFQCALGKEYFVRVRWRKIAATQENPKERIEWQLKEADTIQYDLAAESIEMMLASMVTV